jgi:hypothetical protein
MFDVVNMKYTVYIDKICLSNGHNVCMIVSWQVTTTA